MLSALTQLLIFQLSGEIVARSLALPIPGPVLGMLFLFVALTLKGADPRGTVKFHEAFWVKE